LGFVDAQVLCVLSSLFFWNTAKIIGYYKNLWMKNERTRINLGTKNRYNPRCIKYQQKYWILINKSNINEKGKKGVLDNICGVW